jgi:hypothetical protein
MPSFSILWKLINLLTAYSSPSENNNSHKTLLCNPKLFASQHMVWLEETKSFIFVVLQSLFWHILFVTHNYVRSKCALACWYSERMILLLLIGVLMLTLKCSRKYSRKRRNCYAVLRFCEGNKTTKLGDTEFHNGKYRKTWKLLCTQEWIWLVLFLVFLQATVRWQQLPVGSLSELATTTERWQYGLGCALKSIGKQITQTPAF